MNISATNASSGWFASASKAASSLGFTPEYISAPLMGSGPESSKNLTAADRDVIRTTTGIEIRDNGDILSPESMSLVDYGTALASIGNLAASRSSGQGAELSGADFLQALAMKGYTNTTKLDVHQYEGIDFRA